MHFYSIKTKIILILETDYYFTTIYWARRREGTRSGMSLCEVRSIRLGCLPKCHIFFSECKMCLCTCALYLCLLWELEGVYAVSEVGGECVVQLAQRLLQRLERLFVLLQCLQLLFKADLPVHRLTRAQTAKFMSLNFSVRDHQL